VSLVVKFAATAAVLVALGLAGESDFEAAKFEESQYVERVCSGVHKNYLDVEVACE